MKKILYILVVLTTSFLACKKGTLVESTPYTKINAGDPAYSYLRFINVAPGSPVVNYYLGDVRSSGNYNALTGETGFGYVSIFPISSGQYLPIAPGTNKVDAKIVATATVDKGLNVFNSTINTEGGKYYTMFLNGSYGADKKIPSSLLLEEVKPKLDTSKVLIRLVNLYSGATGNMDVLQNATGQSLISNIAFNNASGFVEIPLPGQSNVYQIRVAGTTTPLTINFAPVLSKGQAYTFVTSGIAGSTTFPFRINSYTSFY
ncbi:DUF4397 domain-containing protein [Pedobacter sp. Leaf170]|uniref:DUF4397 domain-containing protein n=1 Tax=Pedobacter sp. Leaf170 TaxID=2876558 RepID=UPI001E36B7BD|nr:DUF4397 domain-containing protein [Pedobacter sp. Leaf170]